MSNAKANVEHLLINNLANFVVTVQGISYAVYAISSLFKEISFVIFLVITNFAKNAYYTNEKSIMMVFLI